MNNEKKIIAPLSGKVIALDQVPDDVFSQKVLGDGIAIIPTDGKILSEEYTENGILLEVIAEMYLLDENKNYIVD